MITSTTKRPTTTLANPATAAKFAAFIDKRIADANASKKSSATKLADISSKIKALLIIAQAKAAKSTSVKP